jgi:hypothetical protein
LIIIVLPCQRRVRVRAPDSGWAAADVTHRAKIPKVFWVT